MAKPSAPNGYLLETMIGEGAFSQVWRAKELSFNETVAIKITPKHSLVDKNSIKRYRDEVEIHSSLHHPFIVPIFSANENLINHYLIMEFVQRGTLSDILHTTNILPTTIIYRYFIQIFNAVQYLHSHKICHHDLKLQNILIDDENNIRLCDFGFAQRINTEDAMIHSCGSPKYAAPELLAENKDRSPHTIAIDIWALGVILFRISCGYFPFYGETVSILKKEILNQNIKYPNEIDPDLKELLTKMLEKDPTKRIKTNDIPETRWYRKACEIESDIYPETFAGTSLHNNEIREKLKARQLISKKSIPNIKLERDQRLTKLFASGEFRPLQTKRPATRAFSKGIRSETPPVIQMVMK